MFDNISLLFDDSVVFHNIQLLLQIFRVAACTCPDTCKHVSLMIVISR